MAPASNAAATEDKLVAMRSAWASGVNSDTPRNKTTDGLEARRSASIIEKSVSAVMTTRLLGFRDLEDLDVGRGELVNVGDVDNVMARLAETRYQLRGEVGVDQ